MWFLKFIWRITGEVRFLVTCILLKKKRFKWSSFPVIRKFVYTLVYLTWVKWMTKKKKEISSPWVVALFGFLYWFFLGTSNITCRHSSKSYCVTKWYTDTACWLLSFLPHLQILKHRDVTWYPETISRLRYLKFVVYLCF